MDDLNVRDLFAMLAMNGLVARNGYNTHLGCAKSAYAIADAMIEEKEKRDDAVPRDKN